MKPTIKSNEKKNLIKKMHQYRSEIDRIDKDLLKSLNKRARIVKKIHSIKSQIELKVKDPKREFNIISRLIQINKGPLLNSEIEKIFKTLFKIYRK